MENVDLLGYLTSDIVFKIPTSCTITAEAFRRICTDSRELSPGDIFCPLIGDKFDGHDYIPAVFEQGAQYSFCNLDHSSEFNRYSDRLIVVKNTLAAVQLIAKSYLSLMPAVKLAITGSAGKTTMKNLVKAICSQAGETIATPKSFNNEIGVPKTIQLVTPSTKYAIFEIAARHVGDIKLLTDIVSPNVAMCLNVGTAHLGEFGSIENLFQTKMEIYSHAPPDARFVFNGDDKRIVEFMSQFNNSKISFGLKSGRDFIATTKTDDHSTIEVLFQGSKYKVKFAAPHHANQVNAAAALAAAHALQLDLGLAATSLGAYKEDKGRYSIKKTQCGTVFIDDSYNANPESMKLGLMSVRDNYKDQKKILILGDMLELGPQSADLHQSIAPVIASIPKVSAIFTVGQDSKYFTKQNSDDLHHRHFTCITELNEYIEENISLIKSSDVIFVKASLGIGLHTYAASLRNRLDE